MPGLHRCHTSSFGQPYASNPANSTKTAGGPHGVGGEVEKPLALDFRRALKDRDSLRCEYTRMRRQRPRSAPAASSRHSVGERRGEHGTVLRSTHTRHSATCRREAQGQACDVPWARRYSGESSSVHSEHPDGKSARLRYTHRHPHERRGADKTSPASPLARSSPAGLAPRPANGLPKSRSSNLSSLATS